MKEAAIVSVARTPVARAFRGAYNDTHAADLAGHVVGEAVKRAGVDPEQVEEVILGCAMQEGTTGYNISRQAAIRAGLSVSVSAATINRFCASGLHALAIAAQAVQTGEIEVAVAGGIESISLVQTPEKNNSRRENPWIMQHKPAIYMPMLQTAENVAQRYNISREAQDAYAAESHQRTARAHSAGFFAAELVPLETTKRIEDRETGEIRFETVLLSHDEGVRPNSTPQTLAKLSPVLSPEGTITAGNASQFSDGAAALVVMDADLAARRGLKPLAIFRGFASAGCEPDEMGVGPVYAVPKLLRRFGLNVADIGLWELNEAFASQVLYCRDQLGIDPQRFNVNGGAIAVGHPYGMSGARLAIHAICEASRRKEKTAVMTMCVGAGMGAAGLLEIV
ncbi:acetyl-CoA C-acyltransferase [Chelativorans sp. Marseille-P2723]|uniref:acetyl-CoA C-acyltransferase n=1 Tax=Chelativorans sp. Marseille-P2723 TaxID=2709133 RepID=UPI00156D49F8|nr:acetyl-CoA C-acyltransferase [Chelativorans sp. Marseille-P2723]